ncbi:MAG: histidine phosphatase family protein [Bdellovibrionales bacterium]|nr:histidine phosphatase family protein [Bdellovibrionales bacterium]
MKTDSSPSRTVILIRHGQYTSKPEKLTKIGRAQALRTGKVLSKLKIDNLYCSKMPRAIKFAAIIESEVGLKARSRQIFNESILPGTREFMKRESQKLRSNRERKLFPRKVRDNKSRADQAVRFILKKPRRGQTTDVVVAHGNVIRYWVCCALNIDRKKWLSFSIRHGSLSTIRISSDGNAVILGFSDCGHLPLSIQTV